MVVFFCVVVFFCLCACFQVKKYAKEIEISNSIFAAYSDVLKMNGAISVSFSPYKGFELVANRDIPENVSVAEFIHQGDLSGGNLCELTIKLMASFSPYIELLKRSTALPFFNESLLSCEEAFVPFQLEADDCWKKCTSGNKTIFQSVYSSVWSRAGQANRSMIVLHPGVDFANHCFPQEANTKLVLAEGTTKLVVTKNVKEGQELCYSYRRIDSQISFLSTHGIFPGERLEGSFLTTISSPLCSRVFRLPASLKPRHINTLGAGIKKYCRSPDAFLQQILLRTSRCLDDPPYNKYFLRKLLVVGSTLQALQGLN